MSDKQPPFGPKRVGYGVRPQTAQGWLIMLGFLGTVVLMVVAIALIVAVLH